MATDTSASPVICPNCSASTTGRFCANCGAPVQGALCSGCGAPLTAGAKFCHRCGTPAGTAPAHGAQNTGFAAALPWAVAGIALVALISLVAAQHFNGRSIAAAPQSQASSLAAPGPGGSAGVGAPIPAPDISNLSPRERADRLYDLVMTLDSQGKTDSVQFFAQMAVAAYQMLPTQDADSHYDLGRIAEVAGVPALALAQADTILQSDSTHLLGLILAAQSERALGHASQAKQYQTRFLAALPGEERKNLIEYQRHRNDIEAAAADARKTAASQKTGGRE
ncbi:MAG TPA: zinc ribbon domain-containing protein [Gemmatimonadaceae bacterium]|nr:zinc ribbon domain-containing protein [Gemmatimonadaceae bacterium]